MPWGYAAAGVGAYLANSGKGGGGGGTTTQSKEPWAPAQPWITSNLQTGQNLQNYYQANPFNAIQQGAYQNLLQGNDYINQMTPGLLAQMSQQNGFDRNNPRARAAPIQFPAMQQMQPMAGLLGGGMPQGGGMNVTQNPFANGKMPTAAAPAAAPAFNLQDYMNSMRYDPNTGGGA